MGLSRLSCFFAIAITLISRVSATFDASASTLATTLIEEVLSTPETHATLIKYGFESQFFLNYSGIEYGSVASMMYGQIRTLSTDFYHLWSCFENGAFLGYYQQDINVEDRYTIGWQSNANHSCGNYNVSLEDSTSSGCREFYLAHRDSGQRGASFNAVPYDCRTRSWYTATKTYVAKRWANVWIDVTANKAAVGLCVPLSNLTTKANDYNDVRADDRGLVGVACTGVFLEAISESLLNSFTDLAGGKESAGLGAFVVDRSTGKMVAAGTSNPGDYFDNVTQTQVDPSLSPNDAIRFAHKVILNHTNMTTLDTWPDSYTTLAWVRNDSNTYPTLNYDAYYVSTIVLREPGLEWDLVVFQEVDCPVNYYVDVDTLVCTECVSPQYTSGGGSPSCDGCVSGYYLDKNDECQECPEGATCDRGSTISHLEIDDSYWRLTAKTDSVHACPFAAGCKGGKIFSDDGESYCQEGYEGPLCAVCSGDLILSTHRERCISCDEAGKVDKNPILIGIIIIACLIMAILGCCVTGVLGKCEFKPPQEEIDALDNYIEHLHQSGYEEQFDDLDRDGERMDGGAEVIGGGTTAKGNTVRNRSNNKHKKKDRLFTRMSPNLEVKELKHKRSMYIFGKIETTAINTVSSQEMKKVLTHEVGGSWGRMAGGSSMTNGASVKFKLLTAFSQISTNISFNCGMSFPTAFEDLVSLLAFMNLDQVLPSLGLSCAFGKFDFIDRMFAITIIPIIICFILIVFYLMMRRNEKQIIITPAQSLVFKDIAKEAELLDIYKPFTKSQRMHLCETFTHAAEEDSKSSLDTISHEKLVELLEVYMHFSDKSAHTLANTIFDELNESSTNNGKKVRTDVITFKQVANAVFDLRVLEKPNLLGSLISIMEGEVSSKLYAYIMYALLLISFIVLVGTSTSLFHYFNCREFPEAIGATESYLRKDYSINCNSTRYQSWIAYTLIMIIIYPIGIPLSYIVVLREHRVIVRDDIKMEKEAECGFINVGHIKFLIECYRPKYYYFEVIECFRRLALASAIGLFSEDSPVSVALGVLIAFFCTVLIAVMRPYREFDDNLLALILACSTSLLFLSALFIKQDVTNNEDQDLFVAILIAVLFIGPLAVAGFFIYSYYDMIKSCFGHKEVGYDKEDDGVAFKTHIIAAEDEEEENKEKEEVLTLYQKVLNKATFLYESTGGVFLVFFGTFVVAIVSVVMAIVAFSSFSEATQNLDVLIGNWERVPITDIYLSNTSTCPTDYSVIDYPLWPGSTSSACACPSSASSSNEFSSSTSMCDDSQISAGCISQPSIESVDLDTWRGRTICVKREGEAQLKSGGSTRPVPSSAGVCNSGYQACGSGKYDNDRTVCVPSSVSCPITGAEVASSLPSGYSSSYAQTTDDVDKTWYLRMEESGEMPINRIDLVFYYPDKKSGRCFKGGENQKAYPDMGDSYDYINNYPKKCSKFDSRWVELDYQTEEDYLNENFNNEDSCSNDNDVSDYISTGTVCGTSPLTDSDCMMYDETSTTDFASGCTSTDTICKNIYYQSNCGGLNRWATQSDEYWAVMFRREIYWDSECDVSMNDVKDIETPIDMIHSALKTNLILSVIANFLGGMYFPFALFQVKLMGSSALFCQTCFTSTPEARQKVIDWMNQYITVFLCCAKILPCAIALGMLNGVRQTVTKAAEGGCMEDDDKITKLTFTDLNDEMEITIDSLWSEMSFDIMNILLAIATTWYAHYIKAKEAKDSELGKPPGKSPTLTLNASVSYVEKADNGQGSRRASIDNRPIPRPVPTENILIPPGTTAGIEMSPTNTQKSEKLSDDGFIFEEKEEIKKQQNKSSWQEASENIEKHFSPSESKWMQEAMEFSESTFGTAEERAHMEELVEAAKENKRKELLIEREKEKFIAKEKEEMEHQMEFEKKRQMSISSKNDQTIAKTEVKVRKKTKVSTVLANVKIPDNAFPGSSIEFPHPMTGAIVKVVVPKHIKTGDMMQVNLKQNIIEEQYYIQFKVPSKFSPHIPVEVPLVDGRIIKVKIPANTGAGSTIEVSVPKPLEATI